MYQLDEHTVALLHFEDGFKDECGTVWSKVGDAKIDVENSKIGDGALFLPAGAYLKAINEEFKFGMDDFTIDFWVYGSNFSALYTGLASSMWVSGNPGILIANDIIGVGQGPAGVYVALAPSKVIPVNTWTHIAVVKKENLLLYFMDGQLTNQKTLPGNYNKITSDTFVIGARYVTGEYPTINPVYIDEFRISKTGRWTEDFNPGEKPVDPEQPTDPIEPVDPPDQKGEVLLRITMNDSSEREYMVTQEKLNDFVNWINRIGSNMPSYTFDKVVTKSIEYLMYNKIISFEIK